MIFFGKKKKQTIPYEEPIPGIHMFSPLSHTFPPINRTNCFLIGEDCSKRLVVDPSPKNEAEYKRLKEELNRLGFTEIFITHSHSDHHERAPKLAREYGVPIYICEKTFQRISRHLGKNYFEGIDVKFVEEGDVLITWAGQPVQVYEIPGHDAGHLGLAPKGMEWFLVGDLVQGMGTVIIGREEGDMAEYFRTLERVIEFAPHYILPSHGQIQKSADSLQKTLTHRRERERQILELHRKGISPKEMVSTIYRGVNKRLWPYALQNIHSHLEKLEKEGKL